MNPPSPVKKISGINIKTKAMPTTTLSMRNAKNRSQNPAYSTRGTAAYPGYAGMAAASPPIGAATDALRIGGRAAAATENPCPQFEQYAAPSGIAAPHLEQYMVSPRLFPLSRGPAKIAAKSYFLAATGSIHIPIDPSRPLLPGHPLHLTTEEKGLPPQSFDNRLRSEEHTSE